MKILLVIPVLNEADCIASIVESLLAEPGEFEKLLVVVDGGSTDGTREIVQGACLKFANIRLLPNPAKIQSGGINRAFDLFGDDCDMLIRCDAHTVYPPEFIGSLVSSMRRTGADSVVVTLETLGDTCFRRALAWTSNSFIGTGGAAHRAGRGGGFVDHGHHAAFSAAIFRKVGGYDTSYAQNEDAELDCRIREAGGRIYHSADIKLGYLPRRNLIALGIQYFRYGVGRSRTVRRHCGSLRVRQFAVPLHLLMFLACIVGAANVGASLFLFYPVSYAGILSIYSLMTAVRRRSLCALMIAPAAATMHFCWGSGFFWGLASRRERRRIVSDQIGRTTRPTDASMKHIG